jgi:hypothetical protein
MRAAAFDTRDGHALATILSLPPVKSAHFHSLATTIHADAEFRQKSRHYYWRRQISLHVVSTSLLIDDIF